MPKCGVCEMAEFLPLIVFLVMIVVVLFAIAAMGELNAFLVRLGKALGKRLLLLLVGMLMAGVLITLPFSVETMQNFVFACAGIAVSGAVILGVISGIYSRRQVKQAKDWQEECRKYALTCKQCGTVFSAMPVADSDTWYHCEQCGHQFAGPWHGL